MTFGIIWPRIDARLPSSTFLLRDDSASCSPASDIGVLDHACLFDGFENLFVSDVGVNYDG